MAGRACTRAYDGPVRDGVEAVYEWDPGLCEYRAIFGAGMSALGTFS